MISSFFVLLCLINVKSVVSYKNYSIPDIKKNDKGGKKYNINDLCCLAGNGDDDDDDEATPVSRSI